MARRIASSFTLRSAREGRNLNLEDMAVSLEDRVAEWRKPYIEQGICLGREEGISLGRAEGISLGRAEGISLGIEHERRLLRRMAATRFGWGTGDRLAAAIGGEADLERLMAVGEAIARCATGSELLREIGSRR